MLDDENCKEVKNRLSSVEGGLTYIRAKFDAFLGNDFPHLEKKVDNFDERLDEVDKRISFIRGSLWVSIPLLIALCGGIGWLIALLIQVF